MTDDAPSDDPPAESPFSEGVRVVARRNAKMVLAVTKQREDGLIECDWGGIRRVFVQDDLYAG